MSETRSKSIWNYLGPLLAPLLLLAFGLTLWEPIVSWLQGEEKYDQEVLREWIQEASIYKTLPKLVEEYLKIKKKVDAAGDNGLAKKNGKTTGRGAELMHLQSMLKEKRSEIATHLKSLGEPVTKIYNGQLPLFPVVYRLELSFSKDLDLKPITWDSQLPRKEGQYRTLPQKIEVYPGKAFVDMQYHLRVYTSRQFHARQRAAYWQRFSGLATIVMLGILVLVFIAQVRERERQRGQLVSQQKVTEAERMRLQEELLRQEAERRREEAERLSLELQSQLWANIGIMAGSYAHNIKNLLVRPNDLLSRILEADGVSAGQGRIIREVRHTLGTVTERLQQILHTVRRDPTEAQKAPLDLNELVEDMRHTWQELAREKWKMSITLQLYPEPLMIEGDRSHLQQAVENLLFNARDATFEMRNHLREQARNRDVAAEKQENGRQGLVFERETAGVDQGQGRADREERNQLASRERKRALIAAASWKGEVTLCTRRERDVAVLEVRDNGIGMSEGVRERCLETHFSTKRNNALFAGMSAGMGLGLSFLQVILDHHGAKMSIESKHLEGTKFTIRFPPVEGS